MAEEIFHASIEIIASSWRLRDPIRMLTITAINLCDENESEQLSLFDLEGHARQEQEKIERTIDNIRAKFGDNAINFGRVINNDIGIDLDDNRIE